MSKRALAVAAMLLCAAGSAFAGVYYEAVTTTEGKGGGMGDVTVHAWVDGEMAKVEFAESGNPMMGPGSYLLTRNGGKTIYLVNPSDKTYAEWDMEAMMNMAGGAMKMAKGMMNMKFSDPEVEKVGEEPGGAMLGMPTTHYTYRTTYSMEMKFMGMHQKNTTVQDQEIWSTTAIDMPAMGLWLKGNGPKTGDEQLDALVQAEMDKVKGFPLRQVTVTTTTDQKKGKSQTSTTTMEVTKFEKTSVPEATFVIPPSYTETSLVPEQGEGGEEGEGNPLSKLFGGGGD